MFIVTFSFQVFLAPSPYLWSLFSLHHFSIPPILFPNVDPTWCPVFGYYHAALVWSILWVFPWVQYYHFDLVSLVFFSVLVSKWLVYLPLPGPVMPVASYSTKIVSCDCVRLWDRVKFILVRFAIASLSSIYEHVSDCSASAVMTWDSVSYVWFSDVPYPWAAAVAFWQIWYLLYTCENIPWNPASFFGQPECLPTVHSIFSLLLY